VELNELKHLEEKANTIRRITIEMIGKLGVGHVGGALSIADVLAALYYKYMRVDPANPKWVERDRFVLSKGHAGPALYAVLADKGYFPFEWIDTLNQPNTNLPSHCDRLKTPGVDMTAGSLGQGLSAAIGMALGARIDRLPIRVYALIGDGESQEGQIWEAAMYAPNQRLDTLTVFLDYNRMQIDGTTDEINCMDPLADRWKAFGWQTIQIPGHNLKAICNAIDIALETKGKPTMIILDTIKGKGLSFAEGKVSSHNMPLSQDQVLQALQELGGGSHV
jgi:transketolase